MKKKDGINIYTLQYIKFSDLTNEERELFELFLTGRFAIVIGNEDKVATLHDYEDYLEFKKLFKNNAEMKESMLEI